MNFEIIQIKYKIVKQLLFIRNYFSIFIYKICNIRKGYSKIYYGAVKMTRGAVNFSRGAQKY